jgi:PTH1 family peptidyl-tRNA hydrolase
MPPSLVIAGLGNPGSRYDNTPHNAGFEVVDTLAARAGAGEWKPWKSRAAMAECRMGGEQVLLVKPATYMNLSGEAVKPLLAYRDVEPDRLLVVCDDIALPIGRTRLRAEGSSGGQKGLQNIMDHLGTAAIARLRLGVAPGPDGLPCAAERWVLSKWSQRLRAHFDRVVDQAADCCEALIGREVPEVMSMFNGKTAPDPSAE